MVWSCEKVHALVRRRLDYCNSALTCLPLSLVKKLQSAMNSAALLIFVTRFDRITRHLP